MAPDRRAIDNPALEAGPRQEGHHQAQYPAGATATPETLARPAPGEVVLAQRQRLSLRSIPQPVPTGAEPLVLLHGFTQTGASWGPVVDALEGRFPVFLPDAPGHGRSAAVQVDLWATADLLAEVVPGQATWVGYSMGGRTALHLALARPDKVLRLILISTSAGIEDPGQRAARRAADDALAERIQQEGTERFLARWLAQPLFATLLPVDAGLDDRMTNTPGGLASSLRLAGAGAQGPLWARLGELGANGLPVLVLAGELDREYRRHAARMAKLIGSTARTEMIIGAGHACHLERPAEVAAAITRFCAAPPAAGGGLSSEGQADRQ
jgi:2-succinyl-6-hydroxy-2,4-cyclohexadiene-1-carboxylate synthase